MMNWLEIDVIYVALHIYFIMNCLVIDVTGKALHIYLAMQCFDINICTQGAKYLSKE